MLVPMNVQESFDPFDASWMPSSSSPPLPAVTRSFIQLSEPSEGSPPRPVSPVEMIVSVRTSRPSGVAAIIPSSSRSSRESSTSASVETGCKRLAMAPGAPPVHRGAQLRVDGRRRTWSPPDESTARDHPTIHPRRQQVDSGLRAQLARAAAQSRMERSVGRFLVTKNRENRSVQAAKLESRGSGSGREFDSNRRARRILDDRQSTGASPPEGSRIRSMHRSRTPVQSKKCHDLVGHDLQVVGLTCFLDRLDKHHSR